MSRVRRGPLLPALLMLVVLACGAAALASLVEAFEERRAGAAAADLRLAVLLVAQFEDAGTLNDDDRALLNDATLLLAEDPSAALHPLSPELRSEGQDGLAAVNDHAAMVAAGTMTPDSGHSVASHYRLQDLLRISSVTAAEDAARAEGQTAVFSVGLLTSLAALVALLVRARVSSDLYRSAADRFGALLDQSPEATAVIAANGSMSYASAAMRELLGETQDQRSALLRLAIDEEQQQALDSHLRSANETTISIRSRHEVAADANDREFDIRVVDMSEDPVIHGRLVTILETTIENRARRQLEHLAGHDQLTSLPNRRSMMSALATDPPQALLMIDLDDFKKTNDTLGHGAGDELLVAISRQFEAVLTGKATLYRLGGDEFAVLFDGTLDAAQRLAGDLLACLERPIALPMAFERASASIGVAHREAGDQALGLLRRADIALYDAKRSGGGRLRVLDTELEYRSVERSEIARAFQTASFEDEFRLVYQPIVDAATGRTTLVEGLARWTSPAHGVVRPDLFIPLAESSGRIVELGNWVLDRALADLARWRRAGLSSDVGMSINVSPFQLTSDAFSLQLADRLHSYAIEPSSITLELTESALVADNERILARLGELRDMGCALACDDFGSGYSNLGQLMKLPLNLVKVDRELLTTLGQMREQSGAADQPCQVMTAIVSIGEAMNAKIVAEGVETLQQSTSLRESGVQLLQGYLFSRPVEATEVAPLIDEPALRLPA